jgi:hypothetical protein
MVNVLTLVKLKSYLNNVFLVRSVVPSRGNVLGKVLRGQEHGRAQVQWLEDVLASIGLVVALVQSATCQ